MSRWLSPCAPRALRYSVVGRIPQVGTLYVARLVGMCQHTSEKLQLPCRKGLRAGPRRTQAGVPMRDPASDARRGRAAPEGPHALERASTSASLLARRLGAVHGPLHRLVEELLEHARRVEPPAPVLTEGRGIPSVLIQVEAHEPAERHVAPQLHDELAVARDPQQVPPNEGQEQLLRRDRGSVDRRVQRPADASDRLIVDQRPDPAQRCSSGTNFSSERL